MATAANRRRMTQVSLAGTALPEPAAPPAAPPFNYTPPTPQTFTDKAPTATPYGTFTAPDPAKVAEDPYYKFRMAEGLKQQQRGAAMRGTLLTGNFQKALTGWAQGLASEEAGKSFDRALATYGTNRDTHALNFGNRMAEFQGNLGGFNANTNAALGYGRLGLDAATSQYDRAYQTSRDEQDYQQQLNDRAAGLDAAAEYAREMENARAPQAPWILPQRSTLPGRLGAMGLGRR